LLHGSTGYNTVEKIESCTLTELALALDDNFDPSRPPSGFPAMSAAQSRAYQMWWRGLTPRERLDAIRRGQA